MDFIRRSWRRTLFAIVIAVLLTRAAFLLTLQDVFYFPDSVGYSSAAVNLITKGELGQYNRPRLSGIPGRDLLVFG
jgi:hypothetical protein